MAEEEFPTYRLLQPELMTGDELANILRKYNVKFDAKTAGLEELIEIYKRVALPLPQRTYGTSWRERLLAKKQKRRKISIQDEPKESGSSKSDASANGSRIAPGRPVHDRLKPPVDPGKEKRIIKLSSSSSSSSQKDDGKEQNLTSEPEKATQSKTEPGTKRKRITIDFSDSSEKSTPLPRVVSSTKRRSEDKSPSQSVSKHRRIVI